MTVDFFCGEGERELLFYAFLSKTTKRPLSDLSKTKKRLLCSPQVQKALKGLIVLSAELEAMGNR